MKESIVHQIVMIQADGQYVDTVLKKARDVLSKCAINPELMFIPSKENLPDKPAAFHFYVESYASDITQQLGQKMTVFGDRLHKALASVPHQFGVSGGGGFFRDEMGRLNYVYKDAQLYRSIDELIYNRNLAEKSDSTYAGYPIDEVERKEEWRRFENWETRVNESGEYLFSYDLKSMNEKEISYLEGVLKQNGIEFKQFIIGNDKPKVMLQIANTSEELFMKLMTEVAPMGQDGVNNDKWSDIKNWKRIGTQNHSKGFSYVFDLKCIDLRNRDKLKNFLKYHNISYSEFLVNRNGHKKHPVIEIQEAGEKNFFKALNPRKRIIRQFPMSHISEKIINMVKGAKGNPIVQQTISDNSKQR